MGGEVKTAPSLSIDFLAKMALLGLALGEEVHTRAVAGAAAPLNFSTPFSVGEAMKMCDVRVL